MNGNKKVILHLVFDGVLFDQVFLRFENMEKYENRYLFDVLGCNQKLEFIKNTEKLIRVNTLEEWGNIVSNPQVDIIYLHGLWQSSFNVIDYIRQDVIVMWWCYGKEIYENVLRWPPLLPLKLYKPQTHWFCWRYFRSVHFYTSELSCLFPELYILLINMYYFVIGKRDDRLKRLLSRIDFAWTPLEMELLELKKRHPFIKAKPFKLSRPGAFNDPIELHEKTGGVLLEHSANTTNNHLDIIHVIKKRRIDLWGRDVFVPLGYGERKLAERVKKKAVFEGAHVHCLMEAIPYNEYNEMMSKCTHAFFGMIRQSGLGNIYMCFRKGIKVFFYKDSIMYQQFKKDGYHVFSYEDDLNNDSIKEPLTPEQAKNNYNIYFAQFGKDRGTYDQQFDNILK